MPNRRKQIYRFLNGLQFTNEYVEQVKNYITNDVIPPGMNARQQATFEERFGHDWEVDADGELVFTPLQLQAVPEELIEAVLNVLYNGNNRIDSLGKGINSFYDTVRTGFVGITRKRVEEYLKRQDIYQLSFHQPKRTQKPVYANFCNEKWGCDLLDMNPLVGYNHQRRYILTVIDYFSRRAFARPLNNKRPHTIRLALQNICHQIGVHPQLLICDNGPEFNLTEWCQEHNTKLVHTESHTPTQNSLIENFNGQLRRLMRSHFVITSDLNWIDHLDTLVESYNNTKHNGTGFKPIDVWTNDRQRVHMENVGANVLMLTNNQKKSEILRANNVRAAAQTARLQQEHLQVGDRVRVSVSALHSDIRKKNKAGDSKLVAMKFSANIFTVLRVVKSRKQPDLALDRYELADANGHPLLVEQRLNQPGQNLPRKRFNIYDLQRVPDGTVNTKHKWDECRVNGLPYNQYAHFDVVDNEDD
jgi:hypothetical protein